MSETSDGRVLIGAVQRLKQGDLLRVLRERGWTQSEMAGRLGLSPANFGHLINMRRLPKLSTNAQKLIVEWTGKLPEDLVPTWLSDGLDVVDGRTVVRFAEVGRAQLAEAVGRMSLPSQVSEIIDRDAMRAIISLAADCLTKRQRLVINLRYLIDDGATLESVGNALGLTRTRIRQIEAKSIDKMRKRVWMCRGSDGSAIDYDPIFGKLRDTRARLRAHNDHADEVGA